MRKARNNNNFIDKTFTIIADVILRVFVGGRGIVEVFNNYRKHYFPLGKRNILKINIRLFGKCR